MSTTRTTNWGFDLGALIAAGALPENSRGAVEAALAELLADDVRRDAYWRDLKRCAGGRFPLKDELPEDLVVRALQQGLGALSDQELAHLAVNPIGQQQLADELSDRLDSAGEEELGALLAVWESALTQAGRNVVARRAGRGPGAASAVRDPEAVGARPELSPAWSAKPPVRAIRQSTKTVALRPAGARVTEPPARWIADVASADCDWLEGAPAADEPAATVVLTWRPPGCLKVELGGFAVGGANFSLTARWTSRDGQIRAEGQSQNAYLPVVDLTPTDAGPPCDGDMIEIDVSGQRGEARRRVCLRISVGEDARR